MLRAVYVGCIDCIDCIASSRCAVGVVHMADEVKSRRRCCTTNNCCQLGLRRYTKATGDVSRDAKS
jgi:hypothetical protein